jgi:hypothetical protein
MAGDAKATLELVFDTAQLKTATGDIKAVGTETTKATTAVTKMGTASKSVGSKIGEVGKKFSTSVVSAGALAGTVLNLSRQYQDLSDSQIRVDKTQLKVSKTTEAAKKAHEALNKMLSEGITSGAAFEQAQLDVKQAEEAATLAVTMHGEALEDQQRAQENFWIGLVPTVVTAGGTIMSVITDLKGAKGIAGLGTAAAGSVGGLNAMSGATTGLGAAMKGVALSMLPVAVAIAGIALAAKASSLVIHEIVSLIKGDTLEAVTSLEGLINLLDTISQVIGPAGAGFAALSNLKFTGIGSMKDQVAKIKAELKDVPQTVVPASAALETLDKDVQSVNDIIDKTVGGVLGFNQMAAAVPAAVTPAAVAITKLTSSLTTGAAAAQEHATASLQLQKVFTKMAAPQDMYTMALGRSKGKIDEFIKSTRATIQSNADYGLGLMALINKSGILTATEEDSISVLEMKARAVLGDADAMDAYTNSIKANTAAALANTRSMGVKVKGFGPGSVHAKGTARYVTSVSGKITGYGPGVAPPTMGPGHLNPVGIKGKKAQTGMHEMLSRDTMIMAHAKERVDIDKPSRMGGGSGTKHITVSFLPAEFKQFLRYSINEDQGYQK